GHSTGTFTILAPPHTMIRRGHCTGKLLIWNITHSGWIRISWEEAMALAASRLLDIKARYGAKAVVFDRGTTAGSATIDCSEWRQRLTSAFGSPNATSPMYICAWNWLFGSHYTYGVTRPSPDYDHAHCILLWGTNPQVSWPAAAVRISQAK